MLSIVFSFTLSWIICSSLILLGYSYLYPVLASETLVLFIIMSFIGLPFGIMLNSVSIQKIKRNGLIEKSLDKAIISLIAIMFMLNLAYSKELALINVVFNIGSYYKDIENIPTLFPLMLSMSTLQAIRSHFNWLIIKRKIDFYILIAMLFIPVVTMGRGIFLFTVIVLIIQFLYCANIFRKKKVILFKSVTLILIFLIVFGLWGALRSESNAELNSGNDKLILTLNQLAEVTPDFEESIIPDFMLWPYIYIISPISNFDNAVLSSYMESRNTCSSDFITKSILPESFQKNSNLFDGNLTGSLRSEIFNVSTAYLIPFYYCGSIGVIIAYFSWLLIFFVGLFVVRNTYYFIPVKAMCTGIIVMSLFSNMFILDFVFWPFICLIFIGLFSKIRLNK